MCGIVGIFDLNQNREIDRDLLGRMNESLYHRGPNEGGIHTEAGLGFAHRRLSIIDLSSGQQPLFNKSGTVVVTYNGEIYNFMEIRAELEGKGYEFVTHCDTEVIVYAWEEWGENCVDHFRGMFAFAIWDRPKQTVFLARDRLGVKPLYYSELENGYFIFASELKALQLHPDLPKEMDNTAIEEYFAYGYIPDPKTIYKKVFKLPPGFKLTLRKAQSVPRPVQYWDVPFNQTSTLTQSQAQEELMERIKEAVKIRMVADVPLGAFLSGGVDSSAVVSMMAGLSNDPVKTCSISFGEGQYNESEYAQQVAERYHTEHHVEQVDPDDISLIDRLASLYDEPYADSSALPTYRVCELARKSVIVALSGDGGDENLAGYRRYYWHQSEQRFRDLIPDIIRKPLFGTLGNLYPRLDGAPKFLRAKSTLQSIARDTVESYFNIIAVMPDELRNKLYSEKFKRELQGYNAIEVMRQHSKVAPTKDSLSLIQYLDMKTYLPGDILTKVDRASMAHALEVRVPLLDHKLVEWISTLPPSFKLQGAEGKFLFKKALENHLPNDIMYRRKMGFSIPLTEWFRGKLKDHIRQAILSPGIMDSGYFNQEFLKLMVEQHQSGKEDYGVALWSVLMFEAFLRQANP